MVYFITDKGKLSEEEWQLCMVKRMKEGVDYIIIRDKNQFNPQRVEKLMDYKRMHNEITTKIIVHSDLELAQRVNADGIHLPFALWENYKDTSIFKKWYINKLVGISIHDKEEAKVAEGKVNYMFLSPVFHPSCKPVEGKGISWFKEVKHQIKTPLVALGGITPENVSVLYEEGINDIAVMSYLMSYENKLQDLKR